MIPTPKIDNRLPQPLPRPVERVLKHMFAGYREVIVRSEFSSGLSGSRVFQVRPIQEESPELPAVVKIDAVSVIQQEWQAYQACIRNKLPTVATIRGEPVFPPGNPLGGLWYGLAGEGVFEVISLADFCRQAPVEQIESALSRLFQAMAALWEQKTVQPDLFLQTTYDSFLPANLTVEVVAPTASANPAWLHPTTARQRDWQIGDVVQVAGFQPVETAAEKRRLLLNAPDPAQAFRLYLTGVDDVTQFEIGQPIQQPLTGVIRETRHSLLVRRVEELLPTAADPSERTLALDGGEQLPNPLALYREILARSFDANVACIHGDLHLQNILVEPDSGHTYLIDFGKSRRDHVLRDLLQLEMSAMTGLLPEYLGEAGFSPARIHDFYTRLHCAVLYRREVMTPDGLDRPFAVLHRVRQAARQYLFKAERWAEYYNGLGLYLLGALKFDNLDTIARQVAFWGAAIAFALAQDNPDCTAIVAAAKAAPAGAATETEKPAAGQAGMGGISQQVTASGGSSISNVVQVAGGYHAHHYYPPVSTPPLSQLPPKAYHELIGRSEEQNDILSTLRAPDKRPLVVIVGLGGMGKTALAREVAERCRQEKLFDHVVWTSAKTEHFVGERVVEQGSIAYDFDSLLSDIGRQCGRIDIATLPPEQKKAAVAYLLAQQRVLVVMDNLETVPQYDDLVRQVADMLGQSKILITSRFRIAHEQAYTIELKGFPDEDGVAFLRAEGRERNVAAVVQAPENTLLEIQRDTGGAPLAMKLVVGQVSRQPMDVVLRALKQASAKGQDYEFYRFVYWHSWNLLDENSQMALVDMSVFPPVTGGARDDVEAVSQLEAGDFWPAMDQLITMSLVDKSGALGQERFALHPLTHYFILADITEEWADDAP